MKMSHKKHDAGEALLLAAVIKLIERGYTNANIRDIIQDGSYLYPHAKLHIEAGIKPSARSVKYTMDTVGPTPEGLKAAVKGGRR
jgi:hypothetical protein